ncbi:MAG TPA: hypothetical protein VNQ77_00580 [Frankiaceae bacterium]|nr:hypothetical protein [Frankiaceae bacterium]
MRLVLLTAALVAATALPASAATTTVTGRTCAMDWPSTSSPAGTVTAGPVAVSDAPSLAAGIKVAITCWIGGGDPTHADASGKFAISSASGPVASIGPAPASYSTAPDGDYYVCTMLTVESATTSTRYYFDARTNTFDMYSGVPCVLALSVDAGANTSVWSAPIQFTRTL